jgi:predicted DNA-binding WGR domain protein
VGANNNKFFSLELHASTSEARACIYTHYGRVGEAGQRETRYYDSVGSAKLAYNDLFLQKSKKGYAVVQLQSAAIGSSLVRRAKEEKEKEKNDFSLDLFFRLSFFLPFFLFTFFFRFPDSTIFVLCIVRFWF